MTTPKRHLRPFLEAARRREPFAAPRSGRLRHRPLRGPLLTFPYLHRAAICLISLPFRAAKFATRAAALLALLANTPGTRRAPELVLLFLDSNARALGTLQLLTIGNLLRALFAERARELLLSDVHTIDCVTVRRASCTTLLAGRLCTRRRRNTNTRRTIEEVRRELRLTYTSHPRRKRERKPTRARRVVSH